MSRRAAAWIARPEPAWRWPPWHRCRWAFMTVDGTSAGLIDSSTLLDYLTANILLPAGGFLHLHFRRAGALDRKIHARPKLSNNGTLKLRIYGPLFIFLRALRLPGGAATDLPG